MGRKYKAYPEYQPSGVDWLGQIPKHWSAKRLGQFFEERREKVSDKDYSALSVTMKGVVPQLETAAKTDAGDNRKLVLKNDFVINSRSDRKGSSGVSQYDGSVSLISIVMTPKRIVPAYAHHLLRSQPFQEEFYRYGKGIVADLWSTNSSEMKNILIPEMPSDEAEKIANFLDHETAKIDTLIEEQKNLIRLLQEKRQAVISHAVTKGLNPNVQLKDSGVEWLGKVPGHWEVKRVRYLGACQNGINIGAEAFGSGYPFVSYGDAYNNRVLPEVPSGLVQSTLEDRQRYSLQYGDVLFTRTSETIDEIGFASVCLKDIRDACFAGFLIRFRPTGAELDPDFSKYYFSNELLRAFFIKEMNLVTRASLSQDLLKLMPVTLPPLSEQRAIAEFLDAKTLSFEQLEKDAKQQIALMQERRAALISAAVTGKIDVSDWTPPAPQKEQSPKAVQAA
ncbi:restriction endonuclease subunit S [Endozoicomonas sp. GU-1]|uniref:restriction endonuclease subunit S n=1 Tax=Endozoicomonas sp. GU-1 TaxID=3009078 RepID=UPI0022B59FED|nr:restriction endonuclease subunit S [Endozoicomonas sp. GU-1]WBA80063.1 restriction endonuclease subunit S [Endozoicomonas sp. GU-1]WBA87636.1 restriction endonuclease subunit S [Endozoicomonas sp. GU-1]